MRTVEHGLGRVCPVRSRDLVDPVRTPFRRELAVEGRAAYVVRLALVVRLLLNVRFRAEVWRVWNSEVSP